MAAYNWNASYQDLLLVIKLPTLERRRLDLKLGQLFKIMHKLCFFPDGIVKLREQFILLYSATHVFSILFIYINQEHIQILFSFHLCLMQVTFGILYPLIL